MKITVLGSGTNAPVAGRGMAGYIVEAGGKKLFMDMGPGCFYKMLKKGIKIERIENVLVTHCHWDHVCDLITLLFSKGYDKNDKSLLRIFGPRGIRKCLDTFFRLNMLGTRQYPLKIRELASNNFKVGCIMVTSFPVQHHPKVNSIGYKIKYKDKSIVYTGDLSLTKANLFALAKHAKKASLLVIECAYGENEPQVRKHLKPSDVSRILDLAMPEQAILTHLYPSAFNSDIVKDVKRFCKRFKGRIIKARDFLDIAV